jgi:phospholipase/carboxylesterase
VLRTLVLMTLGFGCRADAPRSEPTPEPMPGPSPALEAPVEQPREPAPIAPAIEGPITLGTLTVRLRGRGDRALLLLHGYGAPGDDLVPLGEELARRIPGLRVVLPAAPESWIHGGEGLAWYERARPSVDAQIDRAREALVVLLRELERTEGIPPSRVAFAGFSMGSTMAIELAIHGPHRPTALVALSGNALPRFDRRWDALSGLPVFVSHGRADPILPFFHGERIRDRAREGGAEVTFVEFDGGHEIPTEVLDALVAFLARR